MTVVVRFERIGTHHHVTPLRIRGARLAPEQSEVIVEAVYKYAAPHLFSRDVWVTVDLEARTGMVHAGFRNGGGFTLAEEDDE